MAFGDPFPKGPECGDHTVGAGGFAVVGDQLLAILAQISWCKHVGCQRITIGGFKPCRELTHR